MKKTHAFITVEPKGCFKTKLEFSFDNLVMADGVMFFYGVSNDPGVKGCLPFDEAIKKNGVEDILQYDPDQEDLTILAKDVLTLRVCGTWKYL